MFKIENDVIHITRGDKGVIEFIPDNYTFNIGDTVSFRVYNNKGLQDLPLIQIDIVVTEACSSVDIELTREDTKIGEIENKKVEYWYEIEINKDQTVKGFDEKGAKKLILYPEGADKND